jgi:RNA polymerase sigma factor (sigma-70 family)
MLWVTEDRDNGPEWGARAQADFDLLQRFGAGDPEAGNALFRRYYASVHRFFEVKAGAQADDLTQRTFLACVEASAQFRGAASFRTFLFGIARRQLWQFLRKGRRTSSAMRLTEAHGPATQPTPTGLISSRQEQRLLLLALNWLPADLQVAVQLYYWEGMKGAEIAEVLEIPPSTVRNRLARAREALRQRICETTPSDLVLREALLRDLEGWTRSLVHADGVQ